MSHEQIDDWNALGETIYTVDWLREHPGERELSESRRHQAPAAYQLSPPDLSIRLLHTPWSAKICRCGTRRNQFNGNLPKMPYEDNPTGMQSVLINDNVKDGPPLRLTFDPPIQGFGTWVTVSAKQSLTYWAQCHMRLTNGETPSLHMRSAQSNAADMAPYMAARASPGIQIKEIWLDAVKLSSHSTELPDDGSIMCVGIGDLYVVTR